MNIERAILVAFLGNYLINNVVAAIVALFPQSASTGIITPQYIAFVVLSALVVAGLAWWYYRGASISRDWKSGAIFGGIGFVVAIVTAFISGIAGVVLQTGSFSQAMSVLPNFWPFLANWSTLVLLGYWIIPAAALGWWYGRGSTPAMAADTPKPIF